MKTIDFISSYFFAKKAIKDIKFVQEQVLKDIISIAKNSIKGKEGFYNNINSLDDIVNLPIMDFNDIKDNIEEVRNGLPYNFSTFPVKYLFSTSGTTGEAKLIPGTQLRDLSTIKETATMFAYHQNLNYLLKSYLSGKTLLFVAQPIKSNQQIPIMNISGYQTLNVPKLMKNNIAIDEKIIQMQQSQEKDDLIITSALNSNLSHFALTNANAFLRLYEKLINNWDEYVSRTNGKRKENLIKLKKLNIDNIWPNLSLISAYKSKDNLHHLNLLLNKINKPIFTQEAGFNTSEARITVPSGIHGSYAYLSTTSGIFLGREIKYDNKGNKYLGDFLTADKLTQPGIKIQAYVMTYDLPFLYSTGDEFITGESLGQVPSLSFLGRNKVDNLMNSHTLISDLNQMPYIVNKKLNLPIKSYAVTRLEKRLENKLPRYQILIESNEHISQEKVYEYLIEAEKFLQTKESSLTYHEVRRSQGNLGFVSAALVKNNSLSEYHSKQSHGQQKLKLFIPEDELNQIEISDPIYVPEKYQERIFNEINKKLAEKKLMDL